MNNNDTEEKLKGVRFPTKLIKEIEKNHTSKERFKKFNFSEYVREAVEEKFKKEKK